MSFFLNQFLLGGKEERGEIGCYVADSNNNNDIKI